MDEAVVLKFFELAGQDSARASAMVRQYPRLVDAELSEELLLHKAAVENDLHSAQVMIACGWDVRRKDIGADEPLHRAVIVGHVDMARTLLAAGADANEPCGGGDPPIHKAIRYGMKEMAELLLSHGAKLCYKTVCFETIEQALMESPDREWFEELLRQHGWKSDGSMP